MAKKKRQIKKKVTIDCHGMKAEVAMDVIATALWGFNHSGKELYVITGTGVIRDSLIRYLNDISHLTKFHWKFELNNEGCIIIQIPEWKDDK